MAGKAKKPIEFRDAIVVNNKSVRSDDDALTGHFVKVIAGPHEGRYGVFTQAVAAGADGYPEQILVRTRDDQQELIAVAYADVRPDVAGKR